MTFQASAGRVTQFQLLRLITRGIPSFALSSARRPVASWENLDSILILAELSFSGEWEGQVRYLPL